MKRIYWTKAHDDAMLEAIRELAEAGAESKSWECIAGAVFAKTGILRSGIACESRWRDLLKKHNATLQREIDFTNTTTTSALASEIMREIIRDELRAVLAERAVAHV